MIYDRDQMKADRLAELRRHLQANPYPKNLEEIHARGNRCVREMLLEQVEIFQADEDKWCDEEIAAIEESRISMESANGN